MVVFGGGVIAFVTIFKIGWSLSFAEDT